MFHFRQNFSRLPRNLQQLLRIIFITFLGAGLFSIFFIDYSLTFTQPSLRTSLADLTLPVMSILSLVSALLIVNRRPSAGAWLFFLAFLGSAISISYTTQGFGLAVAFLGLAVTLYIAFRIFSGAQATIAIIVGSLGSAITIWIDAFLLHQRVPLDPTPLIAGQVIISLMAFGIILSLISTFRDFPLSGKILLLTLGTGILSVIGVAGFSSQFIRQALITKSHETLISAAQTTAATLDSFFNNNTALITAEAQLEDLRNAVSANTEENLEHANSILTTLAQRDTEAIVAYTLFDTQGTIIAISSTKMDHGASGAGQDYFEIPLASGNIYISHVHLHPPFEERVFHISVPVYNISGKSGGVLSVRFKADFLQTLINAQNGIAGEGSFAALVDEESIILAHGINSNLAARTPGLLTPEQLLRLQQDHRVTSGLTAEELSTNFPEFSESLANSQSQPLFSSSDSALGEAVQGAIAGLTTQPWKVVIIQPERITLRPVRQQTQSIVIIALLSAAIVISLSLLAGNAISRPVSRLTEIASKMASGDLSNRADITSTDEVGLLAGTLNQMASQLQETLTDLEQRITERTSALEEQTRTLEQRSQELERTNALMQNRTRQLEAVSRVSKSVAAVQEMQKLLPLITTAISKDFSHYFVGLYLVDDAQEYALLSASSNPKLLSKQSSNHQIPLSRASLVSNAINSGHAGIILDTDENPLSSNLLRLPETRSEMVLPLVAGEKSIGALDIHSQLLGAFSDEDIRVLSALTDQVAIAIQNARTFADTRRSLAEATSLYRQNLREEWKKVGRKQKLVGFRYTAANATPLETALPLKQSNDEGRPAGSISIPLKVRDETIGVLNVQSGNQRAWSKDEIDIMRAVAERVAISAENARLFEETTSRAERERTVASITNKIRSTNDPQAMLDVTLKELQQALNASKVQIVPYENPSAPKTDSSEN